MDAGYVPPPGLVFEWTTGPSALRGWILDLGSGPGCLELRLTAKLPNDAGPFVFPEPYQFAATFFLADAGPPALGSAFVTANCGTGTPSFAADASVTTLSLTAQRFGVYRVAAAIGPTQTVSPNIYARPNGYFIFPRNGGVATSMDGGRCVEYQLVSEAWNASRVQVEAATATTFSVETPVNPWILPGCATLTRLANLTMPAGASSVPFALVFFGDAGSFDLRPQPAIPQLGAGYAVWVQDEGTRFCTPPNAGPGSACSHPSECCGALPLCAIGGAPTLTCQP